MRLMKQISGMWYFQESLSRSPPLTVFSDRLFHREESNNTKV